MTFDELRARMPDLGLALYAYEPGGPVTLEVHSEGEVFSFTGSTEAEVIAEAFPPVAQESEVPTPAIIPVMNVFD